MKYFYVLLIIIITNISIIVKNNFSFTDWLYKFLKQKRVFNHDYLYSYTSKTNVFS